MLRRLAQSTTAAHDLITGMVRVPVDVRTARAFTGLIQRAVAAAAGINLQQRFMSVFKDEHDASAAERANEGLVPRPLGPAQTATFVEMLKVGLGLASSHPPTSLFLLVWLPTFASARLTDHRRLAVPQPSLFPQICSVIRNDLSFALCLWHCLLVAVWFVLATLPARTHRITSTAYPRGTVGCACKRACVFFRFFDLFTCLVSVLRSQVFLLEVRSFTHTLSSCNTPHPAQAFWDHSRKGGCDI